MCGVCVWALSGFNGRRCARGAKLQARYAVWWSREDSGYRKEKKDKSVEVDCQSGMKEEEGRAGERQALYVERDYTLSN